MVAEHSNALGNALRFSHALRLTPGAGLEGLGAESLIHHGLQGRAGHESEMARASVAGALRGAVGGVA